MNQHNLTCKHHHIVNQSEVGVWNRNETNGNWHFNLKSCKLHRYTAREARKCLQKRHLVLVGDSIVRLQYLSLMFFLHYGVYPDRSGNSTLGVPNIALEHPMKSWKELYHDLSKLYFNNTEVCDCFRTDLLSPRLYENRYYFDRRRNIRVTFFFDTCMKEVQGHFPLKPTKQTAWADIAPDYEGNWDTIVSKWKNESQYINATAVMATCGAWRYIFPLVKPGPKKQTLACKL